MKKNIQSLVFWGSILLLIMVCMSFRLVTPIIADNTNQTWATLIATDETIVELGDGAHVVEIDPRIVLQIGDLATVFDVKVAVTSAGFLTSAEEWYGDWEYWFIEFSIESTASRIQYGINPVVNSQLQYIHNDNYIWTLPDEYNCIPEIDNLTSGLRPNTLFECRFIYRVPADERELFWAYMRTDVGEDGSYEERYVVYQIR